MGDYYGDYMVEDLSFLRGYVVNLWTQDVVQEEVKDDVSNVEVEDMEVGEDELVIAVPVPNDGELIHVPTLS